MVLLLTRPALLQLGQLILTEGGLDLQQAGDSFGLRVQKVGPFTRLNPGPILQGAPEAIGAAFGGTLGRPSGPWETEYAIFFVEPLHWTFADAQAFQEQKDQLHAALIQQARQSRLQLVLSALRSEANVVDRREELEAERQRAQQAAGTQQGQ